MERQTKQNTSNPINITPLILLCLKYVEFLSPPWQQMIYSIVSKLALVVVQLSAEEFLNPQEKKRKRYSTLTKKENGNDGIGIVPFTRAHQRLKLLVSRKTILTSVRPPALLLLADDETQERYMGSVHARYEGLASSLLSVTTRLEIDILHGNEQKKEWLESQ